MELAELATFAGLSTAVMLLFEAAKRVLAWDAATLDRFGVLISVGIGLAISVPVAFVGGVAADVATQAFTAVVNGVFAGLFAVGIYKGAQASPLPIG